jgi:hypothetical protein
MDCLVLIPDRDYRWFLNQGGHQPPSSQQEISIPEWDSVFLAQDCLIWPIPRRGGVFPPNPNLVYPNPTEGEKTSPLQKPITISVDNHDVDFPIP